MTIYPYGFICLGFEIYARDHEDSNPVDENSLIRFYDENKYVMIHYLDRNRVKKFALRSSMRALEEDLLRHGLARGHRSCFINPHFIKMVRRDESGLIVADMKQEGIESIPISRKYQEEISKIL